MKKYVNVQAETVLFSIDDVLSTSVGNEHGMGGETVPDREWEQDGEEN